jgi:hypothetical protein
MGVASPAAVTNGGWFKVWLQGGPVEDFVYFTMVEPPDRLRVMRDPFKPGWIHVTGSWPEAILYERVRSVEQFDRERIYYPASVDVTQLGD